MAAQAMVSQVMDVQVVEIAAQVVDVQVVVMPDHAR
jgi:hypothetical protein